MLRPGQARQRRPVGFLLLALTSVLPSPSQLIPLQAPLKTMLQIGVMPMLNGRAGGRRAGEGKERGAGWIPAEPTAPTHRADVAGGADPTTRGHQLRA